MRAPPADTTAPLPTLRRPAIEVEREGVPIGHSPHYEITRSILVYVRLRGPPRLPTHMPMLALLPLPRDRSAGAYRFAGVRRAMYIPPPRPYPLFRVAVLFIRESARPDATVWEKKLKTCCSRTRT